MTAPEQLTSLAKAFKILRETSAAQVILRSIATKVAQNLLA